MIKAVSRVVSAQRDNGAQIVSIGATAAKRVNAAESSGALAAVQAETDAKRIRVS